MNEAATSVTFFILVTLLGKSGLAEPVVTTVYGQIRGQVVQAPPLPYQMPQDVYQFTAIPYATPPVGQYRFRKTVPLQSGYGRVLDATKVPNMCTQNAGPQTSAGMGEDCLYLNIWVPRASLDVFLSNQSNQNPLSVYVFIHGGAFAMGSISDTTFNGTFMSAYNNIIVSTIQYRLGSLGFGYLGNEEVPGNMGLWDQLEALKWISQNIASFGGNCQAITLGGESAGAVSTTWHLLSPYSRNYFQRAIIQSGTAISPWGGTSAEVALAGTNLVFQTICNQTYGATLQTRMQCLRAADARLFPATDTLAGSTIFEHILHPVVDGDFMPGDPLSMILSGDFYKVAIMIGANKNEGTVFTAMSPLISNMMPRPSSGPPAGGLPGGFPPGRPTGRQSIPPDDLYPPAPNTANPLDNLTYENYIALMYDRFKQYGGEKTVGIAGNPLLVQAIQLQYWPQNYDGAPKGVDVFQAVSDAVGDYGMLCPTYSFGRLFSATVSKVFAYYFTQRRANSDFMGVTHGSELPFTWGQPFATSVGFTSDDQNLSHVMMAYWSNFVKYGDPNGSGFAMSGASVPLRMWPTYIGNATCSEQYFELNSQTQLPGSNMSSPVICGLKRRNCFFWFDHIPKLARTSANPTSEPCEWETYAKTPTVPVPMPAPISPYYTPYFSPWWAQQPLSSYVLQRPPWFFPQPQGAFWRPVMPMMQV